MVANKIYIDLESFSIHFPHYPQLFQLSKWKQQNPLAAACLLGSSRVAEKIARDNLGFLKLKDTNGQTVLHVASSKGHLQLVNLFTELDPGLCLTTDNTHLVPLQIAVRHGFEEIIRALVLACPRSIEKLTPLGETVFHLAAKHYQPDAFHVLLQLAAQHGKHHLLHRKDRRGDTVLHVAASNKLDEVIVKLLSGQSPAGALVRVNTMNRNGLTALDVSNLSNTDIEMQDIGRILRGAGGLEARSLTVTAQLRRTLETKSVILGSLTAITGAAFAAVCNPPASLLKLGSNRVEFGVRDVIFGKLPLIF